MYIWTFCCVLLDIAASYCHPATPELYMEGFDEALKSFTCKRYLEFVLLLDLAKKSDTSRSLLFNVGTEFKSTTAVLHRFSQLALKGRST